MKEVWFSTLLSSFVISHLVITFDAEPDTVVTVTVSHHLLVNREKYQDTEMSKTKKVKLNWASSPVQLTEQDMINVLVGYQMSDNFRSIDAAKILKTFILDRKEISKFNTASNTIKRYTTYLYIYWYE